MARASSMRSRCSHTNSRAVPEWRAGLRLCLDAPVQGISNPDDGGSRSARLGSRWSEKWCKEGRARVS